MKEEKILYSYGENRFLAIKKLVSMIIFLPIGLYIVGLLIFIIAAWLFGAGKTLLWILYFVMPPLYIFEIALSVRDVIKAYQIKEPVYKVKVTNKGIYLLNEFTPWNNIQRIIAQVGRTDVHVGYKREYHNLVLIERKKGMPIKLVIEKELIGRFNYENFIKALVEMKKEHLIKALSKEDYESIERHIKRAKSE